MILPVTDYLLYPAVAHPFFCKDNTPWRLFMNSSASGINFSFSHIESRLGRSRGQRTGHLYQRGPSWFLQYRDGPGKERRHVTVRIAAAEGPGKLTRKQAERLAWEEHLSKVDQAIFYPGSSQTIEQFITQTFEPGLVSKLKPAGKAHYASMLKNHVIPELGQLQIRQLGPLDVQRFLDFKLASGLSAQTVLHIRNTISAVFRFAKSMRAYTGDLPTEGVRLPPVHAAERKVLNWQQVKQLVEALPFQTGILITVLTVTGMRIGEAMGLKWKYVNLEPEPRILEHGDVLPGYTLAVRENHVLGDYGTVKTPKSRRDILLSAEAWVALSRLHEKLDWRDGQPDPAGPECPVFANRKGTPQDWRNLAQRHLKPAAKQLGIPWVSFHTFRHTWSTLGKAAGLSAEERQRILGHSTTEMTMRYTHAELETMRSRMDLIGKKETVD